MQGSSKLLLLQEHLVIQSVVLNNSLFVEALLSFFLSSSRLPSCMLVQLGKNGGQLVSFLEFSPFLQDTGYYLVLV